MNRTILLLLTLLAIIFFPEKSMADDDDYTGVSFTVGWTSKQEIRQPSHADTGASALSFDLSGCTYMGSDYAFDIGANYGVTVRSFNMKNMSTSEKDPYDTWATRFDLHIGPALRITLIPNALDIVGTARGSLGYAGMTDGGPKMNWGLNLTGDLVIARFVSVGFNYRPFSAKLCSTEWNIDYDSNRYYQIRPSFEMKVGITFLPGEDW